MRRSAYTLVELLVVIAVAGVLLGLAVPRVLASLDRVSVRSAAADISAVFAAARERALAERTLVAVVVDTGSTGGGGRVRARRGAGAGRVFIDRPVGAIHGVRVWASRDSMSYDPRGLGFGAANLSVVVRRGGAAETVFVSRMGRVRR